ncbi:MAG: O-antigen ligase family protein [Candidatus Krumholzibacteriia bacterium]
MIFLLGVAFSLVAGCLAVSSWVATLLLLGCLVLYLLHYVRVDTKPLMLAAGVLQRSCFAMPGYLAAVSVVALPAMGLRRWRRPFRKLESGLVLALVLYTCVSLYLRAAVEQDQFVFPDILATSGPTFYKYIAHALVLYLVLALGLRTRRQARHCIDGYVIATFALALVAFYQQMQGHNDLLRYYYAQATPSASLLQPDFTRITSVLRDSNHLGNFLVVGILLMWGRVHERVGFLRRLSVFAFMIVSSMALFFSLSFTNWISLGIGLLVLLSLRRGWLHAGGVMAVLVLLVATFGLHGSLTPRLTPSILDKATSLVQGDLSPNGPLGIRAALASASLHMLRSSPLLGVGYGAFQAHAGSDEALMRLTRNIVYAHNSFLLVLAELGIIGFLLLLAMLGVHLRLLVRLARSCDPEYSAIGAALVAAFAAALIYEATYGSLLYDVPLWTVLGLGTGLRSLEAR